MNVIEHVLREELAETRAALRKLAVYCFMRYGHDAYLYNSLADLAGMPIALTKCSGCGAETSGVEHVCLPAPDTKEPTRVTDAIDIRIGDVVMYGERMEPPRFQQVTTDYECRRWKERRTEIAAVLRAVWRRDRP